ncbi:MAG: replicative DNA helicase [Synergistaceae bacterium]|nr:replicative DNA helicase [Synergistaceae bacterium]
MPDLRIPPRNLDAERSVLGACILSKEALGSAIEILTPDDFYDPSNKAAFEVLLSMYNDNKPVDALTVSEAFKTRGIYDRLGGQPYLAELIACVTSTANAGYHAEIVKEHAVKRRLIYAGNQIINLAYNDEKSSKEIIEEAERLIFEAAQNKASSEFHHVSELIGPAFTGIEERLRQSGDKVAGYPAGLTDLDSITGGFQPGSLNIIAARPSMGKTALAVTIAQFGGPEGANLPVLIFSVEMSSEQLVLRMLASESEINLSYIFNGTMGRDTFKEVINAGAKLSRRNIYINDDSNLTTLDFRTRCRRFKTKHPDLALIIVDYLQLMSVSNKRTNEGRQQEVAEISRMLKATARELNCPVIALSQLSREAEKRNEKKPQLSDLRDSGAIEQDADTVILIFREDYYGDNEQNTDTHSVADIRVAKNRNGSTGTCKLIFKREITRFASYTSEYDKK